MRREDVGLRLREDVEVIVIRLWNLFEQIWVGRGDGRRGGEGACEKRRRGRGGGWDNGERRGRWERRENAGGGAEVRGEGELARPPVDVGVVAGQPWEAQNELKMTQLHDMAGEILSVDTMDTEAGGVEVGNGACRGNAAIDELERNGEGVWEGLELMLNQDGGIQEAFRSPRVDECEDGDGVLAGNKKVDQKGKMARGGEGEGGRKGEGTAQPGSYWLGDPFFGRMPGRAAGGLLNVVWGEGTCVQRVGKVWGMS